MPTAKKTTAKKTTAKKPAAKAAAKPAVKKTVAKTSVSKAPKAKQEARVNKTFTIGMLVLLAGILTLVCIGAIFKAINK